MDKEVAETMAYFRENSNDLRNLGKEWGLTEQEINECIEQALSVDPKDLPPPDSAAASTTRLKFAARKTWPKLRIFLWIMGSAMALMGLGVLALQNEKLEHRFTQMVQPLFHPFFHTLRLATAPLHDSIDFYDRYLEECIVHNPLFNKEALLGDHACENCNAVTTITQFTPQSLEQGPPPGQAFTEPVLFKGKGQNISFEVFQSILSKSSLVQQPMQGVKTNLDWAPRVADLLNEDAAMKLAAKADFYFFWVSKVVWTSQIMRKVFHRPDIIGALTEVAIRKTIFVMGPSADSFELAPSPIGSFNFYMQGSGSRRVVLTPISLCRKECSTVSVTLTAGDILTYNWEIYTATVHPAGEDMSISFLGHFVPQDV